MKIIEVKPGVFTKVDDDAEAFVLANKWRKARDGALRRHWRIGDRKVSQYLHRLIVGALPNQIVDHENFDRLDNRKSNLRVCTIGQNSQHGRKREFYAGKPTSSRFKGVTRWNGKKWKAAICVDSNDRHIGLFKTELEAAGAYNMAALELHGEFAVFNEL